MVKPLKRILYVEDDQDIQTVTRFALEEVGGFQVEVASSGPEAIKTAPNFRPQLILLDVMMPGMDGTTTFKELRRLPGVVGVPMIFITAKAQAHEVAKYRELGAQDVIVKPYDPLTLSSEVQRIWDRFNAEEKNNV